MLSWWCCIEVVWDLLLIRRWPESRKLSSKSGSCESVVGREWSWSSAILKWGFSPKAVICCRQCDVMMAAEGPVLCKRPRRGWLIGRLVIHDPDPAQSPHELFKSGSVTQQGGTSGNLPSFFTPTRLILWSSGV